MVAPLRRVIVKRPEEAFRNAGAIRKESAPLGYTRPPDLDRAIAGHREFVALLAAAGADILYLPEDDRTGLDSIYTHDPVLVTEAGAIIFQMGKPERRGEGPAFEDALRRWDVPILGRIDGDATAEAGDMVWLDRRTLLVGHSFRTNAAGIDRLSALVRPLGVAVIPVQLPYWRGPREVLHLMSFVSLLDDDLAIVNRPLMPVSLFQLLQERGIELIDVPEQEFESLGCNLLAVSQRKIVMVRGNTLTRQRAEAAGCSVSEFDGTEICLPGAGGPTCLTRPLLRETI